MARRSDSRGAADPGDGAARVVASLAVGLVVVAALAVWAWLGLYQLQPGQSAVILRLGQFVRTQADPGLKWHLPPPLEAHHVVNVAAIEREEFGYRTQEHREPTPEELLEAAMQTSDNNIVHLSFVVQYRIKDAFRSRYRIAAPRPILRDAAQAAVREVVGRTSIDGVLSEKRGDVQEESAQVLQEVLDRYESGLAVLAVQLQDVQPPQAVRDAFDDVIAAIQDRSRTVNEAEGYANEVLPKARAEAIELREAALGYREARVAEARGEAARFQALAQEYDRQPEVVRTRLYLETMEAILPNVRQVVIDRGAPVLPHFPLFGDDRGEGGR
jgi:membrane protease subunit HflK